MVQTRRCFMAGLAAIPFLNVRPTSTRADIPIGSGTLTTVSDGTLVLPGSFLFDQMPKDELRPILIDYGLTEDQLTPECNLALYRDGTNTVLFDVGAGPDFMASAGKIASSLETAGVSVDDITHIVFTHAHPDHIWGLLDEFDDPLFSQASYMMGRAEWDYWWNPETVHQIGEARAALAVGAKRRMAAIEDEVAFFDGGQEILPGIAAISTPGHTPGHMSFELRNGTDAALVLGDVIGNHHVAFHKPDWHSGSDQAAPTAASTRKMLFDKITREDLQIVGFHLPNGGIGRVEVGPDGYRFVQEDI